MKQIEQYLYQGGKKGRLSTRIRIPSDVRAAYGGRAELQIALGTSDLQVGRKRHYGEVARILADFEDKRTQLRDRESGCQRPVPRLLRKADVRVGVDEARQHVAAGAVDLEVARGGPGQGDRRARVADGARLDDAAALDGDVHRPDGGRAGAVDHRRAAQHEPLRAQRAAAAPEPGRVRRNGLAAAGEKVGDLLASLRSGSRSGQPWLVGGTGSAGACTELFVQAEQPAGCAAETAQPGQAGFRFW